MLVENPALDWPPGTRARTRGRAVVIEDHLILRNTIVGLLEELGFDAREAANGFSGLRLARRVRPDLLVLDLVIPDLPGQEVLAELRADPATVGTPVLIVTGFAAGLPGLGPNERLLLKPFGYDEFVGAVAVLAPGAAHTGSPA